jgi:hypothetical protein
VIRKYQYATFEGSKLPDGRVLPGRFTVVIVTTETGGRNKLYTRTAHLVGGGDFGFSHKLAEKSLKDEIRQRFVEVVNDWADSHTPSGL